MFMKCEVPKTVSLEYEAVIAPMAKALGKDYIKVRNDIIPMFKCFSIDTALNKYMLNNGYIYCALSARYFSVKNIADITEMSAKLNTGVLAKVNNNWLVYVEKEHQYGVKKVYHTDRIWGYWILKKNQKNFIQPDLHQKDITTNKIIPTTPPAVKKETEAIMPLASWQKNNGEYVWVKGNEPKVLFHPRADFNDTPTEENTKRAELAFSFAGRTITCVIEL